jgi:hypothetical protein
MILPTTSAPGKSDNGHAAPEASQSGRHAPHAPHSLTAADTIRANIDAAASRFLAADAAVRRAEVLGDDAARVEALAARTLALGEFCLAGRDVADLAVLLLRYAFEFDRDTLRLILVEALRPELEPIADAIARLEARP